MNTRLIQSPGPSPLARQAADRDAQGVSISRQLAAISSDLSYLAPDITRAILDGRQPRDLTAELLGHSRLPLAWHDQRIVLGFG